MALVPQKRWERPHQRNVPPWTNALRGRNVRHMSVMKRHHYGGQFRQADRPDYVVSDIDPGFAATPGNCAARECRDRQRDRNILLSERFTRGLLKVVVARAPRDFSQLPVVPSALCRGARAAGL